MKENQRIYLRDYKAPQFRVDHIDLTLDIFSDKTIVTSKMTIIKNPNALNGELELLGEGMELVKIVLDGKELISKEYSLSKDRVAIHGVDKAKFTLEIQNIIDPFNNTALEGFYLSGNILCTQCEPEGFRKITYFTDRPDVMATYQTTLIADKKSYPYLLSNGNRVDQGDLPDGRHFVKWVDPFRKPSYLFAAVAGDLELATDKFVTKSGRKVDLEIYVDKGQGYKTKHALESLKNSMKWDEDTFGLEYDLDIYMIVAVESFNFGAMENKGLNIFNSAYVLADPKTATDGDYQNIEGVVGHEYFHNWSGNRVTCRDWFQLTLKEGLTVFRDQEFSSDMLSRAVKRIEDVKRLKEFQFAEDAGPMSHPIRPSSYIEINNFYTATVYEKGAEIIRMIHTLVGELSFKKGITEYFRNFDGQAVTTEDFISAMEKVSGRDLTQFKNWYSRPGTPTLKVKMEMDETNKNLKVHVEQKYSSVLHERLENNILHMPFKMAFFDKEGKMIGSEQMVELTQLSETFIISNVSDKPVPSWNRSFSAPVHIEYDYSDDELLHLVAFDSDPVSRYEAIQRVYTKLLLNWVNSLRKEADLPSALPEDFKRGLENILTDESLDPAFVAYLFETPSESQLNQELTAASIHECHQASKHLQMLLGKTFFEHWQRLYEQYLDPRVGDVSAAAMASRAMKNRALSMMVKSTNPEALPTLAQHFQNAKTMTEEAQALGLYCMIKTPESKLAIESFYKKWKHEPLVMLRWFGLQASFASDLNSLEKLENNPSFRSRVPNDLRSLYQNFSRNNLTLFHSQDGSGYKFMAERIAKIDGFNPQVASRLTGSFSLLPKMDPERKMMMKNALTQLIDGQPSKDVFEVASRYLGQS